MCDALSWGILRRNIPEINMKRGQRIGPLTDDEIIAKWGEWANFLDKCGHSALAEYYGISVWSFTHRESWTRIPRPIVKDANAGEFRQCFRASREFLSVRYRRDGTIAETTTRRPTNMRTLSEVRDDPTLYAKFLEEVGKVPILPAEEVILKIALKHFADRRSDFVSTGGFGHNAGRSIADFVDCTIEWARYDRDTCESLNVKMQAALRGVEALGGGGGFVTQKYDQKSNCIE